MYASKVNDLNKGARADDTLETLIDREIEQNLAKKHYSSSRSLIRVKRSTIMLSVMFEQMVTRGYVHKNFPSIHRFILRLLHWLQRGGLINLQRELNCGCGFKVIREALCCIPWMGYQNCRLCFTACPSYKGQAYGCMKMVIKSMFELFMDIYTSWI